MGESARSCKSTGEGEAPLCTPVGRMGVFSVLLTGVFSKVSRLELDGVSHARVEVEVKDVREPVVPV